MAFPTNGLWGLPFMNPFVCHLKPETIDIVAEGDIDVSDTKERNRRLDVCFGSRFDGHRVFLLNSAAIIQSATLAMSE